MFQMEIPENNKYTTSAGKKLLPRLLRYRPCDLGILSMQRTCNRYFITFLFLACDMFR